MSFSFEAPPAFNNQQLSDFLSQLKALVYQPEYISVSCGALGKETQDSLQLLKMLLEQGYSVMPHLACVRLVKAEVFNVLDTYQRLGVRHLLVVRGDLPLKASDVRVDFSTTADLLRFIQQQYANSFKLGVAVNMDCRSDAALADSVDRLAEKVDAGAEFAISQFFYDASVYQQFIAAYTQKNSAILIKPGLMPLSLKNLAFVNQAGVEIPMFWEEELRQCQDDAALNHWNAEKLAALATELLNMGAPGVHFFNCKNPAMLKQILEKTLWPS